MWTLNWTSWLCSAFILTTIIVDARSDGRSPSEEESDISLTKRKVKSPWDKAIIPYVFDEGKVDATYKESDVARERIKAVMSYYEDKTCVKFVPWTTATHKAQGLNHNNRLIFGVYGGCNSLVGNSEKNLLPDGKERKVSTCNGSTARHEIGHALGLYHEQNRPDRDKTIRYFAHHLGTAKASEYKKKSYTTNVPYDISSVMHYNFMLKGLPILLPHDTEDIPLKDIGKGFYGASFYDIKGINLGYECKEKMCPTSTLICENDGYVAYVEQKCRCLCPDGLGGERCQEKYKPSGTFPTDWPEGDFALLAPSCPSGFTEVDHDFLKIFIDKEQAKKYKYCEKKSSAGSGGQNTWPAGQYCLLKVGACPAGFSAGSASFESKKKKHGPSVSIGFCCKHERNVERSISLPVKESFYMSPTYFAKAESFSCQKVEGMRATLETPVIYWNSFSKLEMPYGLMLRDGFKMEMSFCRYDPVNYDCGGVFDLVSGSQTIDFTTQGKSEAKANECTWLFKSPTNSFLQLTFPTFDLLPAGNEGKCKDSLEVRKHLLGQHGVRYCGKSLEGRTIVSQHNHLILTMKTNLPTDKKIQGFKAKVKVIGASDMCYNVTNNGTTYAGTVNHTQKNDPCIAWEKVPKHCFDDQTTIQANMKGNNYCRNPNGLAKPWCFKKMDCQQDMCDVCHLL